ncbi:hypothetical protein DYH09_30380 [bacterium CPR1]|nr:hypothetical protein [bacterium CPR1]
MMVLTIFFMMLITLLAYGYLVLVPSELQAATRFRVDNAASLACDAGIQETMAWLRQELDAAREPFPAMTAASFTVTRNGTLGDWAWEVDVTADPSTFPRGGSTSNRVYLLESRALLNGRPVRQIDCYLKTGESLAKWAWMLDNSVGNLTAFAGRFTGPVHINGSLRIINLASIYAGAGDPVFRSGVSVSGTHATADGVSYDSAPFDGSGNPIAGRYEKIYQGGRPGLTSGVAPVVFPNDTAPQAQAAWKTGAPPAAAGVHVESSAGNVSAGIFIQGAVDEMVLGTTGTDSDSSVMIIRQGANTFTLIEVTGAAGVTTPLGAFVPQGQTVLIGPTGVETVYAGLPNGMVYSTGSINSLYGTNRGARTIAVDMAANRSIRLTHNLLRADTAPGAPPAGHRDTLGLVGQNITIADFPVAERAAIYFYCAIMAGRAGSGGGLTVENIWAAPGGNVNVYGSHVEASAHNKGASDGSTGYFPKVQYDSLLKDNPPPFYPTSGGKCEIRSWREKSLG